MDLLEYQAKELFRQMGIPVLPSQRIDHPTDLKGLRIPFPVVLKSQVYTGARGKLGGIRFVENTIDAIAAAQAIFHLPIMGKYPKVLLAEAKYNPEREFYLAVTLDPSSRRPLLLGSQFGGIDVESSLKHMRQVVVDQEFSPFYARRLALKMGLQGNLMRSVSALVEKMYHLFAERDLDLVEINPLAVSSSGELMALDGKITVNDAALGRQPDLAALLATIPTQAGLPVSDLNWVAREGNIGVLCNGAGLTMATLDLLHKAKGKPASFVDLGADYRQCASTSDLQDRLKQGLDLLIQEKGVKVICINLVGGVVSCLQIAETIASWLKWQPANRQLPTLVVRLVGDQFPAGRGLLAAMDIPVYESMDDAIAETVGLTAATAAKPGKPPSLLLASA
ncbi:succinate--CoA ligase subunit beta [Leptolyngbya sp. NK1-12]|uniref:Succinate--CoA ligase subunit beta n=1 Tax=Leptolyngbya sp. NK1-12 TaxID=2547451 RepID=A0AA96WEE8_9CYAN|nr:succinate--CoA ligase subunit beta [Leptolyngbya sp. NK1-12]WNZ24682.1 succinate--CoA ligase subunit beta [Leptolyngbya sp. NK1-12]